MLDGFQFPQYGPKNKQRTIFYFNGPYDNITSIHVYTLCMANGIIHNTAK